MIQQINNQPVTEANQVQQMVEKSGGGGQLQIQLQRGGQTLELAVRPEALPAPTE